jgi:DNA polymerase elongation subunit (family B)
MNNTFYTNIQVIGDHILHRGYENGRRVNKKVKYRPTLFVESTNTNSKYKTINGTQVEPIEPGTIRECKEFIDSYKDVSNFPIHGDIGWVYQYISSLYPNFEDATYDSELIRVLYIDIENECENGFSEPSLATERINVVTLKCNGKKYVYALKNFELPNDPNLTQEVCFSEEDLLESIVNTIIKEDPDVITGWNVRFYDIPYIVNRIIRVFGEEDGETLVKKLSPWGKIKEQEIQYKGSPM